MYATIVNGHLKIMKFLIEKGISLNYAMLSYKTDPLQLSISCNHMKLITYLIENGATITNDCVTTAYDKNYHEIVTYLIEQNKSLIRQNGYIIDMYARLGMDKMVRFLIDEGCSGYNVIRIYATCHDNSMVKYFIEHGTDGQYIIELYAKSNDETMVKYLIEQGVHPNKIIDFYVNRHNDEMIKYLILYGATISHTIIRAYIRDSNMIKFLIDYDADMKLIIELCAKSGNLDSIKYCVDKGFKLETIRQSKKQPDNSPLLLSINHKHFNITAYLIKHGISKKVLTKKERLFYSPLYVTTDTECIIYYEIIEPGSIYRTCINDHSFTYDGGYTKNFCPYCQCPLDDVLYANEEPFTMPVKSTPITINN